MMSSLRRGRAGELPESPKKHRNDSNGERERERRREEEREGGRERCTDLSMEKKA